MRLLEELAQLRPMYLPAWVFRAKRFDDPTPEKPSCAVMLHMNRMEAQYFGLNLRECFTKAAVDHPLIRKYLEDLPRLEKLMEVTSYAGRVRNRAVSSSSVLSITRMTHTDRGLRRLGVRRSEPRGVLGDEDYYYGSTVEECLERLAEAYPALKEL